MNVLSFFHFPGAHDTSAALVSDGELVAAVEEERLSRVKHDGSIPLRSVAYCLDAAGLDLSEVDRIAFPDLPYRSGASSAMADVDLRTLRRLRAAGHASWRSFIHHAALSAARRAGALRRSFGLNPAAADVFAAVRDRFGPLPAVVHYPHHQAHAATAFLTSGLPEAAVCTADGRGDIYATATWRARNASLERLRGEPWLNSLGFFYRDCTRYLRLGSFGEGKAMGLAAYGDPAALADRVGTLLEVDGTTGWYEYRQEPGEEALGFARRADAPVTGGPFPDFAAAVQDALERALARVCESAVGESNSPALCLGGGVALNCAANGRIAARRAPDETWAFAASGDAGLSVGAALLAARSAGELPRQRLDSAYLGPAFESREIERAAAAYPDVRLDRPRSVVDEAALRLAAGEVIGWFQGRMELGPRALGNRSILADPRSTAIRDRVNRVKGREHWRPLAPTILAERASDYFDLHGESPFMLIAAPARERARSEAPAIVHVDGTVRPQTVRREQNPLLHELLTSFYRQTGMPMLLNTSFNAAGEPIVCSPGDAIAAFRRMSLDVLFCGEYLIEDRRPRGDA